MATHSAAAIITRLKPRRDRGGGGADPAPLPPPRRSTRGLCLLISDRKQINSPCASRFDRGRRATAARLRTRFECLANRRQQRGPFERFAKIAGAAQLPRFLVDRLVVHCGDEDDWLIVTQCGQSSSQFESG